MKDLITGEELPLTRQELLDILNGSDADPEKHHDLCDTALLRFINDEEVTKAFNSKRKWYA